jgi:anaphase-promoting complex subunit 3
MYVYSCEHTQRHKPHPLNTHCKHAQAAHLSFPPTHQEMVALDRLAPQTWCVLGNCFSLQREFETAVKFFHRAIQVDATFTYAYTLAGHEHVSNEDFDKATASFRDALRYDQRHYNAW